MDNVIERLLKQKNERISDLENENKALGIINDEIGRLNNNLIEENKKLKADYIKLSKIVETTGGYKASYVNELRDKIAKLEFDIEAWKKLKAVREDKLYSKGEPVVSSGPCL